MSRILALEYPQDLYAELARVGVDPAAWEIFARKRTLLSVKIPGLSIAGANILKQTSLAAGADCAVHRQTISGKVQKTDAIVFGTLRQLEELCQRLKHQPLCARRVIPELQAAMKNQEGGTGLLKLGRYRLNLNARTRIMGILNITPDSFYDGGRYLEPEQALERAYALVEEGTDIIDIGAESTRPGAKPIPADEQLKRLLPVLKPLAKKLRIPISIDTTSARVAEVCLGEGAVMINDISGLTFDPALPGVIARYDAAVVLMHIKGKPRTMQKNPTYQDLMAEIISTLARSIKRAQEAGINPKSMVVDPGIGFGKKFAHNLEILRRLKELCTLGKPILVGPSRKSFIGMALNLPPEERLEGTIAACVLAVLNGARLVRVHDVRPVRRALALLDAIRKTAPEG